MLETAIKDLLMHDAHQVVTPMLIKLLGLIISSYDLNFDHEVVKNVKNDEPDEETC